MFQIAKHAAYDLMRKKLNCVDTSEIEIPSADNPSQQKTDNMYLHDLMIRSLDEESRQIVILHLVSGYKHREIARLLSLPLGTVLWKYNRALNSLKEQIKEDLK